MLSHNLQAGSQEMYIGVGSFWRLQNLFLASGSLLEIFRILWLVEALSPPSPTICLYLHLVVFLGLCLYVHIFPLSFVFWPHYAVCRVLLIIPCAAVHGVAKSWTRLSDWTELNWTDQGWNPSPLQEKLRIPTTETPRNSQIFLFYKDNSHRTRAHCMTSS